MCLRRIAEDQNKEGVDWRVVAVNDERGEGDFGPMMGNEVPR